MSADEWPEDAAVEVFESCAYCGAGFRFDVRYPVTVREDEDGDLQIFSFCDSDCQDAWKRER